MPTSDSPTSPDGASSASSSDEDDDTDDNVSGTSSVRANRLAERNQAKSLREWMKLFQSQAEELAQLKEQYLKATLEIDALKALILQQEVNQSYPSNSSLAFNQLDDELDATIVNVEDILQGPSNSGQQVISERNPSATRNAPTVPKIVDSTKDKQSKTAKVDAKPTSKTPAHNIKATPSAKQPLSQTVKKAKVPYPPVIVLRNGSVAESLSVVRAVLGHRNFVINGAHIQTFTPDDHKKLCSSLKVDFHTYPTHEEKAMQLVLCRLCSSTTKEDILGEFEFLELTEQILSVSKFSTDGSTRNKKDLPMWRIQLQPNADYMRILKTTNFLNQKVRFEPILNRRTPQCTNCRAYGHTAAHCSREYRCIKCLGSHPPNECPKTADMQPACVNCRQTGHPANFRGCKVYTDLLKRKQETRAAQKKLQESRNTVSNSPRTEVSYADTLRSSKVQLTKQKASASQLNPAADNSSTIAQLLRTATLSPTPSTIANLLSPLIKSLTDILLATQNA